MPKRVESPASEIDVGVGQRKQAQGQARDPVVESATSASTADGWSRCSVISSALPTGRIRVSVGRGPLGQANRREARPLVSCQRCCGKPGVAPAPSRHRRPASARAAARSTFGRPVAGSGARRHIDAVSSSRSVPLTHDARRVSHAAKLFDHGVRLIRLDQRAPYPTTAPPPNAKASSAPASSSVKTGSVVRTSVTFLWSFTAIRASRGSHHCHATDEK